MKHVEHTIVTEYHTCNDKKKSLLQAHIIATHKYHAAIA